MQPPHHRLAEFVTLDPEDIQLAKRWVATTRSYGKGQVIRREGDPVGGAYFLAEGWVGSSLFLRNGRRQMVKMHLPGDVLGLPSLALTAAGETLEAITNAKVYHVTNTELIKLTGREAWDCLR